MKKKSLLFVIVTVVINIAIFLFGTMRYDRLKERSNLFDEEANTLQRKLEHIFEMTGRAESHMQSASIYLCMSSEPMIESYRTSEPVVREAFLQQVNALGGLMKQEFLSGLDYVNQALYMSADSITLWHNQFKATLDKNIHEMPNLQVMLISQMKQVQTFSDKLAKDRDEFRKKRNDYSQRAENTRNMAWGLQLLSFILLFVKDMLGKEGA